jgi:hypothetical protein
MRTSIKADFSPFFKPAVFSPAAKDFAHFLKDFKKPFVSMASSQKICEQFLKTGRMAVGGFRRRPVFFICPLKLL